MRLRDHYIRRIRHGRWLIQPVTPTDGEPPSRVVDTFAEAAEIALPAPLEWFIWEGTITVPRHFGVAPLSGVLILEPPPATTEIPVVLP